MPIQLRCFNNIWPFFTKVAPLPVWFLHPWLSATNGFYRNYQELGGGKMGGQKIIPGGHLPPLAPPPGAATGWTGQFDVFEGNEMIIFKLLCFFLRSFSGRPYICLDVCYVQCLFENRGLIC